ncbi:hypothetical protein [Clostridium baratii]|uniref:hypothetical protein n=1 Tax=Clostridium baratii TaxID=1561 RepID=UPI001C038396|nr:hypothetical protein [Clostridium baratii]MBT9832685.1 hypothetical protein [Clostridium baratii]
MKKTLLSVCIIAKNDSDNILSLLDSIKDIADEINILNIGLKDNLEAVRNFNNTKIYDYKENCNYKNILIDKSNSKWILILNNEEILSDDGKENIIKILNEADELKGLYIRKISIIEGKRRMSYNSLRLFKNESNIRFNENICDSIYESIYKNYGEKFIGFTDIEIYSYENDKHSFAISESTKEKIDTLINLGDSFKNLNYYFKLGNEYGKIGNYKEAIESYDKALTKKDENIDENIYKRLLLNKIKALHQRGLYSEESTFIKNTLKEYSDFRDLYFMECLLSVELCEFSRGSSALNKYIETKKDIKFPSSEFEEVVDIEELNKKLNGLNNILK